MPKINNWSIVKGTTCEYTAPELIKYNLQGNVSEDNRFEDYDFVHTSHIQELNLEEGYAKTKNTRYELGTIDEEYIKYLKDNNMELKSFKVS